MIRQYIIKVLILFLLLQSLPMLLNQHQSQAEVTVPKHILILHSDEEFIPANIDINKYLIEKLKSGSPVPLVIYSEYLDARRFPVEAMFKDYKESLIQRYQNLDIDLLIAVDYKAYQFLTEEAPETFSNKPIVFCMLPRSVFDNAPIKNNVTGNFMNVDINGTLKLIQSIHRSQVKSVDIIAGNGTSDNSKIQEVKQLIKDKTYPFNIQFVHNKSIEDYKAYVASRPSDTVIVYISIFEDILGRQFIPREALKQLDSVTKVPIYGLFYSNMDSGLTGGSLFEFKQVALDTARRSLEILSGKKPSDLPVLEVPNKTYMNFSHLERWHISLNQIPKDVEIHNRVYTPFELYFKEIILVVSVILILVFLLVALSIQLHQKQRAKGALLQLNETLEDLVELRTESLKLKNLELENAQQALVKTEKMQLLQGLTQNLLHKINTPLGVSISYIDLLNAILSDQPSEEDLKEVIEADGILAHLMTNQQKIRSIMNSLESTLSLQTDGGANEVNLETIISELRLDNSSIAKSHNPILLICYPTTNIKLKGAVFKEVLQCLIDFSNLLRVETATSKPSELSILLHEDTLQVDYQNSGLDDIQNLESAFDPFAALPFKNEITGLELTILHNLVTIGLAGTVELVEVNDQEGMAHQTIRVIIPIENLKA